MERLNTACTWEDALDECKLPQACGLEYCNRARMFYSASDECGHGSSTFDSESCLESNRLEVEWSERLTVAAWIDTQQVLDRFLQTTGFASQGTGDCTIRYLVWQHCPNKQRYLRHPGSRRLFRLVLCSRFSLVAQNRGVLAIYYIILISLKDFSKQAVLQTTSLLREPHESSLNTKSISGEPEVNEGKFLCVAGLRKVHALVRGVASPLQVRYLAVFYLHRQLRAGTRVTVYHIIFHNIQAVNVCPVFRR